MTPFTFRRALQAYALLDGNGYADIWRDECARPLELLPLDPSRTWLVPRATMDKRDGDLSVVEIHACQLFDVGPATYPAYSGTAAGIRASGADLDAIRAEATPRRDLAKWEQLAIQLATGEMADESR